MTTRRRGWSLAAVAAAMVMGAGACGTTTSDAAARQVSGAVVRDAAERTGQVTSGQTVVRTRFEGFEGALAPGDGAQITVDGAFDVVTERARVSVDLAEVADALGGGVGRLGAALLPGLFDEPSTAIVDSTTLYVSSPLLAIADSPTPWVSSPIGPEGVGNPAGGFADPLELDRLDQARGFVAYLEGVAEQVDETGVEEFDGVEVTRYEGVVELDRLVAELPAEERGRAADGLDELGAREVPFVVWIDAAGLVRKVELRLDGISLGGPGDGLGTGTVVVTAELVAPDQPVAIEVPAPGEVTPVDALDAPSFSGSPLLPGLGD